MRRIGSSRLPPDALPLIRAARVAHLASADAGGQPLVIPICFVFDGQEFFSPIDEKPKRASPKNLKRLRNVRDNPKVSLIVDHYDEDWRRLSYVLITGQARALLRGKKHNRAVKLLRHKYPQYRRMAINDRPMIVVVPRKTKVWKNL